MKLLPLDTPERIELVAGWLGKAENYKWLDFGNGVQRVTSITLRIMSQRDIHVFRIYTAGDEDTWMPRWVMILSVIGVICWTPLPKSSHL